MSERAEHQSQQPLPTIFFSSSEIDEIRNGAHNAVESHTHLPSLPYWSVVGAAFILLLQEHKAQDLSILTRKDGRGAIIGAELFLRDQSIFPFIYRGNAAALDSSWTQDDGTFRTHIDAFEKYLTHEKRIFPRHYLRLITRRRCTRRSTPSPMDFLVSLGEVA